MNDSASQQQQGGQPLSDFDFGDYIANPTGNDTHHHHQHDLDIYPEFPQQRNHSQMNLDSNLVSQNLLGPHNRMDHLPQVQSQNISAEMLNLKGRLEQQMKLQQLQQLILQQQIELISGHPTINAQQKEVLFHGLLTPGPSAELPAIVPKDLVPPMMLQSAEMFTNNSSSNSIVNQLSPHPHVINPSFSAPAALAFPNSPPFPLPSPAQPGYDLSPLTSPWILPGSTAQRQQNGSQQPSLSRSQQQRPHLKRTVSSSGDEQAGMRKRVSLSTGATSAPSKRKGSSPSSASSTPAIRGTCSAQVPIFTPTSDTPSPVDLSMPPPAPPSSNSEQISHLTTSSASSSSTLSGSGSNSVSPNIAPMTPATILNLRKLTTGLMPMANMTDTEKKDETAGAPGWKSINKSKVVARSAAVRGRRGSTTKPSYSPNLKPLLPGAVPPTPTSPLANPVNSTQSTSPPYMVATTGTQGPRKTSHKAAEQKRRDSLKTSFDELRLLLPPVPLLPEDGADEPPLPGSMPPRGPPKGDADGPNRGVSKLALLRCGIGYIRELKDMVERRDKEIDVLRDEVRRLRIALGEDGGEGLDLERDVDEGAVACGAGSLPVTEGNGGDGDEEGET